MMRKMTHRQQTVPRDSATIEYAGETLTLMAARALYWLRTATLFIADPHFGKTDAFQTAGIPVPGGATDDDLARLSKCITATRAERLVILGDFFHTRHSQSAAVLAALDAWRNQHPSLAVTLIAGNHDRHAGPPPAELAIETVAEPFRLRPFTCHHHPPEEPMPAAGEYILAGHTHPVAVLRDIDGSRHRFPCFHVSDKTMVLPAFGSFTGGHTVSAKAGDHIFLICGGLVHAVNA